MPVRRYVTMTDRAQSTPNHRGVKPMNLFKPALMPSDSMEESPQHQAALAIISTMGDAPEYAKRLVLEMMGLLQRQETP